MSKSRSASSMTRYLRLRSEKPFVFSMWSSNRPGVATMICGFFPRAIDCETMSIPPTITAQRTAITEPRASKASPVWNASSRVGARTRPKNDCGLSISAI